MKITFLGGGNMANALIGGLLKQGFAVEEIQVVEVDADTRERLARNYGVRCHAEVTPPACDTDVILLAVKPQQMKEAVAPVVPHLSRQLIISIAAGLRLEALSRWLGGYKRIVRSMPNTPAVIGAGVSGLHALPEVGAGEKLAADRVLRAVGTTVWIDDEAQMDAVTAVSGSGPAYVFLFIEAMQQAALELGFSPLQARQLSIETIVGAARLAAQSGEPAATLRERVTSKGGTTEAALRVMLERGLKEAVVAGVHAANARGVEMGKLLGAD